MKKIILSILLSLEMLLASQVLCDWESQKEEPLFARLKDYCLLVAQSYEANDDYDGATWYYLLAGENRYIREVLAPKVFQDENVANIAHAFVLESNFKEAEKYYRYFLASHHAEDAKNAINIDYVLLHKLYPQYHNRLTKGLALWNRVFENIERNGIKIVEYKRLIAEATKEKDYSEQLELFKKSLPLYIESFGKENYNIASLYDNIGASYNSLGQYTKALDYRIKALNLREKILSKNSLALALSYNNMGVAYQILGNQKKALAYFEKSLSIREKVQGSEHEYVALLYSAMGRSYTELRNFSKAKNYLQKAITIYEKTLGTEHLSTSHAYQNLAGFYLSTKDYQSSIHYFQKALVIREKKLHKADITFVQSYASLAEAYKRLNQEDKALPYLLKSIEIIKNIKGVGLGVLAGNYESIGWIYFAQQKYAKAYEYAKKAFDIFSNERESYFPLLSAIDKKHYLKKTKINIVLLIESAYLSNKKENLSRALNDWLGYKGSIFDSENMISTLYERTIDKGIKTKIDVLNLDKRALAKLYQEKANDLNAISNLENKIALTIKELNAVSSVSPLNNITYKEIAQNLQEHELYIDFARIAENYFVFTIDKDGNRSFTFLDVIKTKEINRGVLSFRRAIKQGKKPSVETLSRLYHLLIKNFVEENSFKSKTNFIISPDGLLNLFPFETLMSSSGEHLIEKRNIRYIASGKELLRLYQAGATSNTGEVVLFNNPDFDESSAPKNRKTRLIGNYFQTMHFSKLPGTKAEAEAIKKILHGNIIREFEGINATEINLLATVQPKILHIATHGFFIKKALSNPMLKSGLALAGANKGEGVLTALKLSGLNLKGTELVVLSACETGVMDIDSTDSISGLAKAFIQAGAKDIVVSLWAVSDMGTKDLMTMFYEEMKVENSPALALQNTKLKMIKKNVPIYIWSAFILSGM